MKTIFLIGLAISATITFQACQSADKKSSTTKDSVLGDTSMVNGNHVSGAESTETAVDEEGGTFLKKATVGGLMEVEAAKIATKNAKSAAVKAFAEQMLTDHTKINKDLEALAIDKKVMTPDALPAEDLTHLNEMKRMTGSAFDKHYMNMMVSDHEKTVSLFKQGILNRNNEIKSWAKNTLVIIEEHMTKAKEIALTLR